MKRIKNKGGFTLVELLVTIAISLILAGVVTMSLIAYNEYASFKRQNEYAQTLFVAAQNALTKYSENGELDDIDAAMERYTKPVKGEDFFGEVATNAYKDQYDNRIYTIIMNKDGSVLSGGNQSFASSSAGYKKLTEIYTDIFDPYVYDKSILNDASVAIEFDPVGGVVYSVLYSDRKAGLSYGTATADNYASISNRDSSVRKSLMLGYYGIDDLSDLTSRVKEKPVIDTVRLVNSNSLYLQFSLTEKYRKVATSELNYEVELYSASGKPLMSFTLPKLESMEQSSSPTLSDMAHDVLVTKFDKNGEKVEISDEEKEDNTYKIIAFVDSSYRVHIYLDSIDTSASVSAGKGSMSIKRFGLDQLIDDTDTSNIYATVRGEGGRYKTTAWKRSNTENMYFASEVAPLKVHTYGITNSRHLYNIRFSEETGEENVYKQTADFSWTDPFEGAYGSEVFEAGTQLPESADGLRTAFPAILSLSEDSSFNGVRYEISDLVLRSETTVGLFINNSGSIENATLTNSEVEGGNSVGAFCGTDNGELKNLRTKGGSVEGVQDVGGIVGKDGHKEKVTYSDLHNGAAVSGRTYVGGIIGQYTKADGSIENCTNTGLVSASTKEGLKTSGGYTSEIYTKYDNKLLELIADGVRLNTGNGNDQEHNIFRIFTELNNGGFPGMNEDMDLLAMESVPDSITNVNVGGQKFMTIDEYFESTVWVPILVKASDGDGDIIVNKSSYYLFLGAELMKNGETPKIDGSTKTAFAFRIDSTGNAKYYIRYDNKNNDDNCLEVKSLSDFDSSSNWHTFNVDAGTKSEVIRYIAVDTMENEPAYIGGIVGLAKDIGIKNCTNNQTASDAEVQSRLSQNRSFFQNVQNPTVINDDTVNKPLLGVYVGGIAGMADKAEISNSYSTGGYVFGSKYVGGIVGYTNNELDGSGNSNEAGVIGRNFAGGIAGVNASTTSVDANGFLDVAEGTAYNTDCLISGWTNKGVIIATENYGGGITGFNLGRLEDNDSNVNASSLMQSLSAEYGGDYIGGIAGYNGGVISSDSDKMISSYVAGKNYIGGVIGFNANKDNTSVSDYGYSGGYIRGENFVGGFVGLNMSTKLFGSEIKSNPNSIVGKYAVGGVVGGNVLVTNSGTISTSFRTDNFLGSVNATAFAGGYIGFNAISASQNDAEALITVLSELKGANTEENIERLNTACGNISSNAVMNISGRNSTISENRFSGITAEVYVGGVIGYNSKNTGVNIRGITNKSPITASSAISAEELSGDYNKDSFNSGNAKTYSYAGGIVGKCTEKMTITDCSVSDAGKVYSKGTYTGGLVEVNEGRIINCEAGTIGSSSKNYVGGIVGLNKSGACVTGSVLDNKTVTGRNIVGGIVAENFGTVNGANENNTNAENIGKVVGYGQNIGGIVGINRSGSVENYILGVNIEGSGTNVGGAVGRNEGVFNNITYRTGTNYSVRGKESIGGLIGLQVTGSETTYAGLENYASVTADYGAAGGIIGRSAESKAALTISESNNFGTVQVLGESTDGKTQSAAGGIIGQADSFTALRSSGNHKDITGSKGYVGGIVGITEGTVESCMVDGSIRLSGDMYTGGIAGQSAKSISKCSVSNTDIVSSASGAYMGGIVARNTNNCTENSINDVNITASASPVYMGGIAGSNAGTISGTSAEEKSKVSGLELGFTSYSLSNFGYIGGVAGVNEGNISGYSIEGSSIQGGANDPSNPPQYNPNYDYETNGSIVYGYGGIAGINGTVDPESNITASVENCSIDGTTVRGYGDPNNIVNLGGVTGVNGKDSSVNGILYGNRQSTVIATSESGGTEAGANAAYGHVGGVAGYNYGIISKIGKQREVGFGFGTDDASETARMNSGDRESLVNVYTSQGHVGGIVGYNKTTAKLTDCVTGANWNVTAMRNGQDNGCGGIIGYNSSSNDVVRCDNWAKVTKSAAQTTAVGGIVGRNEITNSSSWTFNNCVNFGDITGNAVGGIIGRVKYHGGTFLQCANYGTITNGFKDESAGGIVSDIYSLSPNDNLSFNDCANYGTVVNSSGSNCGGILGYVRNGEFYTSNRITMSNCVNTGVISGGTSYSAGIFANIMSGTPNVTITNCRNYYASSSSKFSGILGNCASAGKVQINYCYGVASSTNPVAAQKGFKSGSGSNYYFGAETSVSVPDFYVTSITHYLGTQSSFDKQKGNTVDGNVVVSSSSGNCYLTPNSGENNADFVYEFDKETDITSVEFWPHFPAVDNGRKFTIQYSSNGTDWKDFSCNISCPVNESPNLVTYNSSTGFWRSAKKTDSGSSTAAKLTAVGTETVAAKYIRLIMERENTKGSASLALVEISFNNYTPRAWMVPSSAQSDGGAVAALTLKESGTANVYNVWQGNKQVISDLDFKSTYIDFVNDTGRSLAVAGGSNNKRQTAYLSVDPMLKPLSNDSAALTAPTNLAVADVGSAASVTWDCSAGYRYEVSAKFDDGTEISSIVYDKSWQFSTEGHEGQSAKITVTAYSINGGAGKSGTVNYSIPAVTLVTPSMKFVLNDLNNSRCYKVVVENIGDYQVGDVIEFQTGSSKKYTVTIGENGILTGDTMVSGTGTGNIFIRMYARRSGAGNSPTATRESMMPTSGNYASEALGKVTNNSRDANNGLDLGFCGITPDTLSYNLGISAARVGGLSTFYRSELVATEAGGIPVVYSYGQMRASGTYQNSATNNYMLTSLTGLPENIADTNVYSNVFVQSFPIAASNELVFTGETISKENYTMDQIKALKVKAGAIDESGDLLVDGTSVKAGYEIVREGEGQYSVSYNALLAYAENNPSQIQVKIFSGTDGDVRDDVTGGTQKKPVISEMNYDEAADTFTAKFDQGTDFSGGADYSYTLTGLTENGDIVTIATADIDNVSSQDNNVISMDGTSWSFTKLSLTVNRKGTFVGSTTMTASFGNSTEQSIGTKLRLPELSINAVTLKNKNDLIYNVSWDPISGESYAGNVDHYRVIIEGIAIGSTDPITAVYDVMTDDPASASSFDIDLGNVSFKDKDGNTVTGSMVGGRPVDISLVAVAKGDKYRDSAKSASYELEMPQRLDNPLSNDFGMESNAEGVDNNNLANQILSISQFEDDGFTLSFTDTDTHKDSLGTVINDYGNRGGKYELAISVTNKHGSVDISTKKDPITMSGTKLGDTATAVLTAENGLTSEFGGGTIKISIRAVSDNYISSLWTELSTMYLPGVKMNAIDLSDTNVLGTTEESENVYVGDSETPDETTVLQVNQDSFSFIQAEHTTAYKFLLTRYEKPSNAENQNDELVDQVLIGGVNEASFTKIDPEVRFIDSKNVDNKEGTDYAKNGQIVSKTVIISADENEKVLEYSFYERKVPILDANGQKINDMSIGLCFKLRITITKAENSEDGIGSISYLLELPDAVIPQFTEIPAAVEQKSYSIKTVSLVVTGDNTNYNYNESDASVVTRDEDFKFQPYTAVEKNGIAYAKQMSSLILEQNVLEARAPTVDTSDIPGIVAGSGTNYEPDPTPAPTAKPTETPTTPAPATPAPTAEPTKTPVPTVEPTPTPTEEPTPTPEPTPESTAEPTPVPENPVAAAESLTEAQSEDPESAIG